MKHCRYCARDLPLTEFSARKASPDGLGYKCRECSSAYARAHYKKPEVKERFIEKAAGWAEANRERRKEIVNAYDDRNRGEKQRRNRDGNRRRRQERPHEARMIGRIEAQRRRHRAVANQSFMHPGVVSRLLDQADSTCMYCEKPSVLTVDHIVPVSRGGNGQWGNLAACCKPCNSSKKDKPLVAWAIKMFGAAGALRIIARIRAVAAIRLPT